MTIVFRKKDFEQLEFKLVFINLTSGTECKLYNQISVDEMTQESMLLKIPTNSCNVSHALMFLFYLGHNATIPQYISSEGKGKGVYFSVTGKVIAKSCDVSNADQDNIEFKFIQFDQDKWQDLINKFKEKQENINTTMNNIRRNE